MNRRRFITASALGAAGFFTGCATARGPRPVSPNSKLNHACIGQREREQTRRTSDNSLKLRVCVVLKVCGEAKPVTQRVRQ